MKQDVYCKAPRLILNSSATADLNARASWTANQRREKLTKTVALVEAPAGPGGHAATHLSVAPLVLGHAVHVLAVGELVPLHRPINTHAQSHGNAILPQSASSTGTPNDSRVGRGSSTWRCRPRPHWRTRRRPRRRKRCSAAQHQPINSDVPQQQQVTVTMNFIVMFSGTSGRKNRNTSSGRVLIDTPFMLIMTGVRL